MSDRKDLPTPNATTFETRVRETLMTYLGRTGDPLDRGVTLRDLLDSGLAKLRPGRTLTSGSVGGSSLPILPVTPDDEPDLTPPPTPTGFTVSAAISHIFIEHDTPDYTQGRGHLRTRVYGKIVQTGDPLPVFANAVEITQFTGKVHAHPSNPSTTWRLWIKWETVDEVVSVSPAGGTNGLEVVTGQDVSLLLNALAGEITSGQLATSLGDRINLIDAPTTGLVTQVENVNGKYTVKVDAAGHVSGFGLATTANVAESPFSEFGVRANRFWIAPPAVSSATAPSTNLYKGYVWRDTGVTPNVTRYWTGSAWTTAPQNLPFVVVAGPTGTINGVTVNPGVYIDTAFIADATITNAKIGNAAIDDAKIASLSAAKITAGTLDVARLGANSITADRIRVTSKGGLTIISEDPMFGDSTLWTTTTNISFLTGDTTTGGKGGTYVASSAGTDRQVTSARRFEIDPTKIYRLSANLYRATGSDRNIYLFLQFYDGAGTYLGNAGWGGSKSGYTFGGLPTPTGEWVRCGNSFGAGTARTIPATARFCEIGVWFNYSGNGATTAEQRCQDLRLDEYINGGQLIVDGSVTATQINSNGLSIRDTAGNVILSAGASVAASNFLGNVTGNVNGVAAATVQANAANGASAWGKFSGAGGTLPSGNVEFNFAGSSSKGGNATNTDNVAGQTAAVVASATSNFNTRNDRKSTAPASPTVPTDGTAVDHVINTDGAADISFEWGFTGSGDAYDIDGFLVYVRQGATNATYTFGTTPSEEVVYTISADRRAFILYGVPADRHYTFGVRAYRIVDQDVSAGGILQSAIVKATASGENPYQPASSVAFAGNVSGTVNNVAGSTLTTAATNFNARNDRNATAVVAPTVANAAGTIDHAINNDGSADVSFEWTWSGAEADIDGFIVYVHDNGASAPASQRVIDGNANASETVYYVTPQRRAFIVYGAAADHYYTFGVQAYRIVDPDISATGVLRSAVAQPASNATETTLGAYRPSANVAFAGNVTGTVNNVAAATLTSNAANGNSAWAKFSGVGNTLPSGNVEFNFAGSSSKGGNATNTDSVGGQTAAVVASATSNFNNRNDRKSTTPAAPTILTDGTAVDHVINTDGAADVSFEWGFTGTGDAYDIDGFLVYVRQGATNSVYAFGTTPAEEVVYTVASDRRAFILYGVPADKHYTFGVRAYRIVDQDVSASGIVQSAIVKATGSGENPYQPSASVAFGGDVSGTVNGVAGSTLTTAATNFNNRNDRIATAVVAPVVANAAGTLDHVTNTDGSADISFEWTWGGTESQIDGFIVFVHDNGTTTPTAQRVIDGAANASETVYYLTPQRRAFILSGAAANHWYTFGVRAYRIVDPDINAAGVLNSAIAQPASGATETTFGAYRPSSNVSFTGDVAGTVNGTAAATVATGAANGTSALNAINDGTTGLATKLSSNARTALTGSGGVAVGSLQWNTSGVRTSGQGIGLTSNGLAAYNAAGAATFSILASDGSATFAGALSAATGSFTGAVYGGSYTSSYAWPAAGTEASPNFGFHLGPGGLLLGNYNTLFGTAPNQYRRYLQIEANGNLYAPGFSIINGSATFSGTVSANVINTEAIIGGAASTGAVTTTTAASASITITVPSGASAVLIEYYLGPDTVNYTGGGGKDGGGGYTYGPILTGLTATPSGGSPSTTASIIVSPAAGTYTITATRSYYTGTMRLGAVVLKR